MSTQTTEERPAATRSGFAGLNGAALDDGADAFTGQGRLAWNVVEPVVKVEAASSSV